MAVPAVTLAQLTLGPSIDSRTITLWLQIAFGVGGYPVGGVPSGIATLADQNGIDAGKFLAAYIQGEATEVDGGSSLPTVGGIIYKYVPSTDKIQMFNSRTGLEFTSSELIPPSVLNDIIVGQFTYVRL